MHEVAVESHSVAFIELCQPVEYGKEVSNSLSYFTNNTFRALARDFFANYLNDLDVRI